MTRGRDGRHSQLSEKSVAFVGVGSIGSHLAMVLAQYGIASSYLIDPDPVERINVARHLLTGKDVGRKKAKRVAEVLSERFPDSHYTGIDSRWEVLGESSKELTEVDLIISTTGDWGFESALNTLARKKAKFPNVIFGQ